MRDRLFNRQLLYWLAIIGYGFFLAALFSIPVLFSRIETSEWERMQDDPMCLHNGGNSICESEVSAAMILGVLFPICIIVPSILVALLAFIWEFIKGGSLQSNIRFQVFGVSLGVLSVLFYLLLW